MKVIIGIDESPYSQAALKWVREMHWPAGTRILVYSSAPFAAYALVEPGGAGVYERIQQEQVKAHEQLVTRAEHELRGAGLTVTGRVERGDPREGIVHAAETERADLVVVGSHGRTGLAKLMIGSVASHVLTHAPCSVVVVKRPRGASS
jgi:nucleotide-binding universal stress UspA family protein